MFLKKLLIFLYNLIIFQKKNLSFNLVKKLLELNFIFLNTQLDFDDSHFDFLLSNDIYSSFLIGNPPQNISVYYLFLEYQFYLSKYNDSKHYNIDKSFTYTLIKHETFYNSIYYRGSFSTDHFNLLNEQNKS